MGFDVALTCWTADGVSCFVWSSNCILEILLSYIDPSVDLNDVSLVAVSAWVFVDSFVFQVDCWLLTIWEWWICVPSVPLTSRQWLLQSKLGRFLLLASLLLVSLFWLFSLWVLELYYLNIYSGALPTSELAFLICGYQCLLVMLLCGQGYYNRLDFGRLVKWFSIQVAVCKSFLCEGGWPM